MAIAIIDQTVSIESKYIIHKIYSYIKFKICIIVAFQNASLEIFKFVEGCTSLNYKLHRFVQIQYDLCYFMGLCYTRTNYHKFDAQKQCHYNVY